MADAANGATEDVLSKEEKVAVEEALSTEEVVDGGVAEKIDAVEESVEVSGVEKSVTVPDGEGLAAEVEEKEVAVESEVVTEEASETSAIPMEDGKGVAILDQVAGVESSETAYVVTKESEEASLSKTSEVPPAVVEQEEIPESTGNPAAMSASAHTPTSWRSCCGLFDVLRHSQEE